MPSSFQSAVTLCFVTFFCTVFVVIFTFPACANPEEIAVGARVLGMGRSGMAIDLDPSGIFLNPAAIVRSTNPQIMTMSGKLMEDVSYQMLSGSWPTKFGTFAVGYINSGLDDIALSTVNSVGSIEPTGENAGYFNRLTVMSFSSSLSERLSLGINGKYYSQGVSGVGRLNSTTANGFDVDLGMFLRVNNWSNFGLSLQNALPASHGGKITWNNGYQEAIPAVLKTGLSMQLWGKKSPFKLGTQRLLMNVDGDFYPVLKQTPVWHTGLEWWPNNLLAMRIGVDGERLSYGVGLYIRGFTFDYAYHEFSDLSSDASHFFSVGYVGEEVEIKKKRTAGAVQEYYRLSVKPRPELEKYLDVPDNYWAVDAINYLSTLGIMRGDGEGYFNPEGSISRAEMATMLVKAKDFMLPTVTSDPYLDLPRFHWAAPYVKVAVDRGYITPPTVDMFYPSQPLSRSEAVVILSKYAGLSELTGVKTKPFPDVSSDFWAAGWIWSAKNAGLLEYLTGDNFVPEGLITRAEVAEMISKTAYGKHKINELIKNPQEI